MVRYLLGHFDVFYQSFSTVRPKICSINLQLKAKAIDDLNLSRWQAIQFSHAFNFLELHIISILEFVSLVLMNCNNAWIFISCIDNNERFCFFSICISNNKISSVVQESETSWSISSTENKTDVSCSAEFVDFNLFINVFKDLSVAYYIIVSMIFKA